MSQHLIFYDGECGLCDHTVQLLLKIDKKEKFIFAPLQGITAKEVLKDLSVEQRQVDSLILVEDYQTPQRQFYFMGKGALKIAWLLGDEWKLIGWLSFLPSFLFDACYRIVAKNRHVFFKNDVCVLPSAEFRHRFLP